MQPLKCTCGACQRCRHREYCRRSRAKREAKIRQPRSFAITAEQAEAMTIEQWLRLPRRVQERIVNDYCKEPTL